MQCPKIPTLLLLFLLAAASDADAASFLIGLGIPPDAAGSDGLNVSPDGGTAVGQSFASGGVAPWTWSETTGQIAIASTGSATAASSDGAVVVGQTGSANAGAGTAFLWTPTGGIQDLGPYPGGVSVSRAEDVSADGAVIAGYYSGFFGGGGAFRWTEAGGVEPIGTLPGTSGAIPYAISGDGSTIVGEAGSGTNARAFRWTSASGMTPLGALFDGGYSRAEDISLDGAVAVGAAQTAENDVAAVRWTSAGISSIEPGGVVATSISAARAVDASGNVVAGIFRDGAQTLDDTAFLWTPDTGMQYLAAILDALGVDHAGWGLTEIGGISADGRTIVGYGTNPDGFGEAWLVHLDSIPDVGKVPEPGTALLVLLGTAGLALRRETAPS